MTMLTASDALIDTLNDLFTRAYYSAAGYVFESQPFGHRDDEEALGAIRDIRMQERNHARMLGQILESFDRVPEPGAFPYWDRDLNYLTVPYMARFVAMTLEHDLVRYDSAIAQLEKHMGLARAMLKAIRTEKAEALAELAPLAELALKAEQQRYAEGTAALKKARADRLAKEKAEREAKRKARSGGAAAAVAGMPDPDEPGISNKERAKRYVLRMRALKAGTAGGGAGAVDPYADLPDPNEPGISNKEKAKRTMLRKRRQKELDAGK